MACITACPFSVNVYSVMLIRLKFLKLSSSLIISLTIKLFTFFLGMRKLGEDLTHSLEKSTTGHVFGIG